MKIIHSGRNLCLLRKPLAICPWQAHLSVLPAQAAIARLSSDNAFHPPCLAAHSSLLWLFEFPSFRVAVGAREPPVRQIYIKLSNEHFICLLPKSTAAGIRYCCSG